MKRRSADRTDQDRHLWHSLTRQVEPLKGRMHLAQRPAPSPRQIEVSPRPFSPPPSGLCKAPLPGLQSVGHNSGTAGLDASTEKKFRAGKMPIDARLDLHGMTQAEAHRAAIRLVTRAYNTNKRCLLIITGKGGFGEGRGVLRRALPLWLEDSEIRPMILSLSPARVPHGGTGAYYVLLRRKRS